LEENSLFVQENQGLKGEFYLGPGGTPYYLREDQGLKGRRAYHGLRGGQAKE